MLLLDFLDFLFCIFLRCFFFLAFNRWRFPLERFFEKIPALFLGPFNFLMNT